MRASIEAKIANLLASLERAHADKAWAKEWNRAGSEHDLAIATLEWRLTRQYDRLAALESG